MPALIKKKPIKIGKKRFKSIVAMLKQNDSPRELINAYNRLLRKLHPPK